jgi:hypothetical protein
MTRLQRRRDCSALWTASLNFFTFGSTTGVKDAVRLLEQDQVGGALHEGLPGLVPRGAWHSVALL